MAYPQVLIPPSVKPANPLELTLADEQTVNFSPRFGRGTTQRQAWGDPLWTAQVRFEALSGADRARVLAALGAARGGASNILMTPGIPLRGSFPATELLTNNDFSNGTTGWTASQASLSVSDRVLRLTFSGASGFQPYFYQNVALTQYAPHVMRSMILDGAQTSGLSIGPYISLGTSDVSNYSTSRGLLSASGVPDSGASDSHFPIAFSSASGFTSGAYAECAWSSLSRCAQIDNGPNALLYSDQIDNAAWTKANATVTASVTGPDGGSTADRLIETTATGVHSIIQSGARTNVADDLCAYGMFKTTGAARDIRLYVGNDISANYSTCIFNLTAGTAGSVSNVGTSTNGRAYIKDMGNGWYFCFLIAHAVAAATIAMDAEMSASGSSSYTGSTSASVDCFRVGATPSSVPTRGALTTTAATTGTNQTGSTLYVKGLPANTSGLLLAGDFVEINGELERCVASLDSDAAGLGVLQLSRARTVAVADNDPIIINNPMGRFRLASDPRITERFGVYTDVDLALIEATA